MPFISKWVDPPKNLKLQVYKKLPDGYVEISIGGLNVYGYRVARTSHWQEAYYCEYCNGWILGYPNDYEENTIGILSGRRGTSSYCCRCGKEIGFNGCVA